ncbi:MAG: hypothetical protein ACE14L_06660 [Terriglobales bacterium]
MLRDKGWLYPVCLASVLCLPALARDPDRHLDTGPAREVLAQSAYLHGYIHGYEDGFREGDLDIHFGRQPRPLKDLKQFRKPPHRKEYGDKRYFCDGYQQGFRAAYTDALQGSVFRGEAEVRRAAEGLNHPVLQYKEFDQAISSGYDAGHKQGRSGTAVSLSEKSAEHCLAGGRTPGYCEVYARGFSIGFYDALVTQRPQTRAAHKRQVSP